MEAFLFQQAVVGAWLITVPQGVLRGTKRYKACVCPPEAAVQLERKPDRVCQSPGGLALIFLNDRYSSAVDTK